jgi:hypothetical protein
MRKNDGYAGLPKLLRRIARASSLEAALRLAEKMGGTRIYVPAKMLCSHELVRCMGEAGGRALGELFGGSYIVVPLDPRAGQHARVRAIRRGIRDDRSSNAIAREVGCTRRAVQHHRRKLREKGAQFDLFED